MNAILKEKTIHSVHIDIDPKAVIEEGSHLEASGRSELHTPKMDGDNSFLLASSFEIKSPPPSEWFCSAIVADFIFEADGPISDHDTLIQDQCLPLIQKEIESLTNKVLSDMGYSQFLGNHV